MISEYGTQCNGLTLPLSTDFVYTQENHHLASCSHEKFTGWGSSSPSPLSEGNSFIQAFLEIEKDVKTHPYTREKPR